MSTDLCETYNPNECTVFLNNLTKKFKDVVAVESVTLGVRKGEFLSLLGPSGSGKSTVLMMIAGFHTPSSGEVFISGEMVAYKPPFKRNIGMVFQNYALFPHMTVFENIAFPLRMRKVPAREISEAVEEMLVLIKLTDLGGRYPKQLSGGQQQRVALARALVYNPPVLLMDEPLGALDKKLREHMQFEIKHLHESLKISIIYVTHDQTEALVMSDRIAIMNKGRIEQIGSPSDTYERPSNRFVADFIGETNFLDVSFIDKNGDRFELVTPSGVKISSTMNKPVSTSVTNVAIRPEKIHFFSSFDERVNSFDGVVTEVIYAGDVFRYKILIENKEVLSVIQQNVSTWKTYRVGDRVIIGWQEEDMNLL